jgi:hypothetical protein
VSVGLVLAHHPLVTALPFVVPAVLVVGLISGIVWRDRREDRDDR